MHATLTLLSGLLLLGAIRAEETPPSIEYPSTRTSTVNIDAGGVFVGVDKGIEWQGVKVYLSLTFNLVAVDTATQKTIWHQNVSAFWNKMTFKEVPGPDGQKVWAVELRANKADDAGQKLVEYRDLKTGVKIETAAQKPAGESLMPVKTLETGCAVSKPFVVLASTAENFKTVWNRLNGKLDTDRRIYITDVPRLPGGLAPVPPDVDFQKFVVVVYCLGDCTNVSDLLAKECYEDANRILLRCETSGFQTMGGGVNERLCEMFFLPRREGKQYLVEHNDQQYIGGPAIWNTVLSANSGDAAHELDKMPKVTKVVPPPADFKREIKHRTGKDWHDNPYEYDYYMHDGKEVFHGKYQKRDKRGLIEFEGGLIDGERHGLWTYYVRNDRVKDNKTPYHTENYDHGELHGPMKVYNENGTIRREGGLVDGMPHGVWKVFYTNGAKMFESSYERGLLHGVTTAWDVKGNISKQEQYENGKPMEKK